MPSHSGYVADLRGDRRDHHVGVSMPSNSGYVADTMTTNNPDRGFLFLCPLIRAMSLTTVEAELVEAEEFLCPLIRAMSLTWRPGPHLRG